MTDRPNRVGQQLGNYSLISLLGEGGFAEVYLGEHIHLGTKAAVKVLHAQLTHENVEAFRTEARTIAHLVHPHIVRVLDFGVEDKTPFLVMDYAPHGTLRNLHPRGSSLAVATIVTYVKQVTDALQYAHDEKLIHRDIKPENMLVGRRNEVFLSDFGIALVAQSSHYQSIQDVIGTIVYMSPEQIQGKPRPASDQYSLGIIVYEWLTGDRPFHGSFTELCTQHMFASPSSLRAKVPTISPDIEHIVMTALAKDPKQRFANVQAFATALEQASQSVQSQPSVSLKGNIPRSQPLSPAIPATPLSQSPQPISDILPVSHSYTLGQTSQSEQMQPSVPRQQTPEPNSLPTLSTTNGGLKQNVKAAILILALLVIILSSGIYRLTRLGGTHSTQGSRASLDTPNAIATAAAIATAQANIILTDALDHNSHDWLVGPYNNHVFGFENGAYHIANNSPDHLAIALLPDEDVPEPFTYTITMNEVKGDDVTTNPNKLNLFGLVLLYNQKDQNNQAFYCFEIKPTNNNAEYQFRKYDSSQADPWTLLWHQPLGNEYHTGQGSANSNTVKVVANRNNFTFLVNGNQVGSASDNTLQHGQIGMLVNQAGAEIAFSNLLLTHT